MTFCENQMIENRKEIMKKHRNVKNNTRRRMMLKKIHQRVLLRRKQFVMFEIEQDFREAC